MNTNLKGDCLAVCLLLLCSGCIAQNHTAQFSDTDCNMIHTGKLDYKQLSTDDAKANSAYINCAIGVRISEPDSFDENDGTSRQIDITRFADHFLRKIDPGFKDPYGNSLLSVVVISFTPLNWKLATAQKLADRGVDIHSKNAFGKTALDLAKTGSEPELTRLLEQIAKTAGDKQPAIN